MSETEEFGKYERPLFRRKFARSDFLRLAGAGAMLPAYLAALGSMNSVQAAVAGFTGGEYPIGIWWPPPPSETTVERYREISTAGFNFVIGGNGVNGHRDYPAALDAAAANGLRYLLSDGALQQIIREGAGGAGSNARSTSATEDATPSVLRFLLEQEEPISISRTTASNPRAEISARIRDVLARYGQHPALAGLGIYDEPHEKMFGLVGYAKQVLQQSAPGELPYVDVWPSYASANALGTRTYEAYLERYFEVVRPPVLAFDHYPLLSGGGITPDYFYNWAIIRKYALRFGVPSWSFIQSVGFDGRKAGLAQRRSPNEQELLWQVNVSLAYGAKGIQYFTYWTPATRPDAPIRFGQAMISSTGQRTPLYAAAARANGYLQVIGKRLLPLVSESVVHAGEKNPPRGARPFQKDGYVASRSGSPVILSRFRNPAGRGDRYLLVVNRSSAKQARVRLKLRDRVRRVYRMDRATGGFSRVRLRRDRQRRLGVKLAPGAARLFLLRVG